MCTPPTPPIPPHESRLQSLEEHLGFLERANEQLAAEILELNRRVKHTTDRLQRLEAKLTQLATADESPPADVDES